MSAATENADPIELAKFDSLAQSWWDPKGPSKPLHDLNPLRLSYVERIMAATATPLAQARVVDVGCGGGILSESMARTGADVLGIDLARGVLEVAELHALEASVNAALPGMIAAEALALEQPQAFDLVTCMEMLEHVPDPAATLRALAALVRPGGNIVVSTLNRTPQAFLIAILGAEYIARVLPRGTHEYLKFIRPSELAAWGREAGLELLDLTGIAHNPLTRSFSFATNPSVNYLAHFRRRES
jgi:2-polyprenyl-6-hydroxyphenyl methylase/3-demethylubiquinone-9 3-methyltransferase